MNFLDLFSGIGGFSLGLEWAGFKTIAFCESDKKCKLVLKKHWPDVPIYPDIKELTYDKLKKDGIGTIDIVCGGFPCQPHSTSGKRKGQEDDRYLWPQMRRIIEEVKPTWVIAENVAGIISLGLDNVLVDLENIGYSARPVNIPAVALGAWHIRKRIWILAHSNNSTRGPKPECKCEMCTEKLVDRCRNRLVSKHDVADSDKQHDDGRRYGTGEICRKQQKTPILSKSKPHIPNTNSQRCQEQRQPFTTHQGSRWPESKCGCQWKTEPDVGRVVNGFPGRVDRLKQLGNAVVPQIPYLIGKAIMEMNKNES